MSPSTITLLFLLFAVIMFVLEKIPLGVTSMIVCIGLVVTGVLDVQTAFAGFIDSNVILFVAMFIVGGALFRNRNGKQDRRNRYQICKDRTDADHCDHGDRGSNERSAFQYGNCRSPDSGGDRNCREIRISNVPDF